MDVDLRGMRKPYKGAEAAFTEESLVSKEPFANFRHWFDEAHNSSAIYEANSMSVATATKDGIPSVRILLLKGFDKNGFKFFTNYDSRKGKELESNPHVALTFYWTNMGSEEPVQYARQVRIEGRVEKLSVEESETYFQSRPRESQISATASPQSQPIPSAQFLIDRSAEIRAAHSDTSKPLPRPKNWGGYLVKPEVVEFWHGDTSRKHDRIVFRRPRPSETIDPSITKEGEDGWLYERLSP